MCNLVVPEGRPECSEVRTGGTYVVETFCAIESDIEESKNRVGV